MALWPVFSKVLSIYDDYYCFHFFLFLFIYLYIYIYLFFVMKYHLLRFKLSKIAKSVLFIGEHYRFLWAVEGTIFCYYSLGNTHIPLAFLFLPPLPSFPSFPLSLPSPSPSFTSIHPPIHPSFLFSLLSSIHPSILFVFSPLLKGFRGKRENGE